jgi:hypothetical protein
MLDLSLTSCSCNLSTGPCPLAMLTGDAAACAHIDHTPNTREARRQLHLARKALEWGMGRLERAQRHVDAARQHDAGLDGLNGVAAEVTRRAAVVASRRAALSC